MEFRPEERCTVPHLDNPIGADVRRKRIWQVDRKAKRLVFMTEKSCRTFTVACF